MKKFKANIQQWIKNSNHPSDVPEEVVVIVYCFQRVYNGYELFLNGYNRYDEKQNTWLLFPVYETSENFYSLREESLELSFSEIYEVYKRELTRLIIAQKVKYPKSIKHILISERDGSTEKIDLFNAMYQTN